MPDALHFRSLIATLGRCSQWQRAVGLWQELRLLDAGCYGAAAVALATAQHWKRAMEVLTEMAEKAIHVNLCPFLAGFHGFTGRFL